MEFDLRPSVASDPLVPTGKLASLAPDVVVEILQHLPLFETWNLGGLNRHLRLIVQQEVGRRIRHYLQSAFHHNSVAFMDKLRDVGGALMGWGLLELFYAKPRGNEVYLPPTVIVPSYNFNTLHLFLLALTDMVSFEHTWMQQGYRSVCNGKWVYHLRVLQFLPS